MKETNNSQTVIFCQRANEWLKKEPLKTASQITEARTLKLIHELDVQQIKLIMLNEELKMAQEQTKVAIK